MIAVVQVMFSGEVTIAELLSNDKSISMLNTWKSYDGKMWLKSWVKVLEELDVHTTDEARLAYPEYFI